MYRLKSNTRLKLILRGFKLGVLNQEDFIHDIVRQEAKCCSEQIKNFLLKIESDLDIKHLKNAVHRFQKLVDKKLSDEGLENFSLNERDYILLKFHQYNQDDIDEKLSDAPLILNNLNEDFGFFDKLRDHDWYIMFKKAFQLELLNRKDRFLIDADVEAYHTASLIYKLAHKKSTKEITNISKIYQELINYYMAIEYKYLSNEIL